MSEQQERRSRLPDCHNQERDGCNHPLPRLSHGTNGQRPVVYSSSQRVMAVHAFGNTPPIVQLVKPLISIAPTESFSCSKQTHRLTDATLVVALVYLRHDTPARGPFWIGVRKDGSVVGTMGERAIRARVRVLGQQVGIANLSPHDCRHAWATSAMCGGTDVAVLQDAGGWWSPAMPPRYAESSAIANERVSLG